MNYHPADLAQASELQRLLADNAATLRWHGIALATFVAVCVTALGAAHVLAWQGITLYAVR